MGFWPPHISELARSPKLAADVLRFIWRHPAARRHRVLFVLRAVGWQVYERIVRRPITIRFSGMRLRCYPHDWSSTTALYVGLYDLDEMSTLKLVLRDGGVFIDVGANVGVYSLVALSQHPAVRVIAFEPSTTAFERLRENVLLNGSDNRVKTIQAAVGASSGIAAVTTNLNTMNRLATAEDGPTESVPLTTIDSTVISGRVDVIKIDVEGAELDVLRGAARTIAVDQPLLIVEDNAPVALRQWLANANYEIVSFDRETATLNSQESGAAKQNIIARPR